MSSTKSRQRSARARVERELALRAAQQEAKRRRNIMIGGGAGGAVLVIVIVVVLIAALGGNGKAKAQAGASPSAVSSNCVWHPNPNPSGSAPATPNPYLKDVGTPPTTDVPVTGDRTMTVATNLGPITVQVDNAKTPCAAASFAYLAGKKFFDNTSCYRMHDSGYYILQCGDPTASGKGGPTYSYTPENVPGAQRPTYITGEVGVGTPPDSGDNGSQFFIVYKNTEDDPSQTDAPASILPANYTVLGTVTSGMDIVQKVAAGGLTDNANDPHTGKPKIPLTITTLTVTNGAPTPQPSSSAAASPSTAASGSASPAPQP